MILICWGAKFMFVLQVLCRAVSSTDGLTAQQVIRNEHGEEVHCVCTCMHRLCVLWRVLKEELIHVALTELDHIPSFCRYYYLSGPILEHQVRTRRINQ